MAIGIIDYGMGNLHSVENALKFLGVDCFVSNDIDALETADKLILPGVGAFYDAITEIKKKGFHRLLNEAKALGKPILGICLGMQLLFDVSYEFGEHQGLGLIPGKIVKLDVPLKIPHMGWNKLNFSKTTALFEGLTEDSYVYFVHSYYLEASDEVVIATTHYGKEIQIAAQFGQVYALQFHPEKSGEVGLRILKNFAAL